MKVAIMGDILCNKVSYSYVEIIRESWFIKEPTSINSYFLYIYYKNIYLEIEPGFFSFCIFFNRRKAKFSKIVKHYQTPLVSRCYTPLNRAWPWSSWNFFLLDTIFSSSLFLSISKRELTLESFSIPHHHTATKETF